jgi:hypothetical protein
MLAGAAAFFRWAVNGGVQVPFLLAQLVQSGLQRLLGLIQLLRAHAAPCALLRLCLQHQIFDRHRRESFR